jgi:hypothetical protein
MSAAGSPKTFTAFEGSRRIISGSLAEVAAKTKPIAERPDHDPILIFDDETAETVNIDFRGDLAAVLARLAAKAATTNPATPSAVAPEPARGPGRPKLGVVAREVTLLPRHWEWLSDQPGGASVTLRKLVDLARRQNESRDGLRRGREVVYRFITVMAGNAPDFEEATRALFAGDRSRFVALTRAWPKDVRNHALQLSGPAFTEKEARHVDAE